MSDHDWHRPKEDSPYCDVQLPSLPPMYRWTCSKCGKVAYRDCSKGKPPMDGCAGVSDLDYRELYHELKDAVNELQKKQPYCFDPDNPIETLQTIGNFIDEVNNGICRNDSLKRGSGIFICSQCGVYLDIADMSWDGKDDSGGFYEPTYCPNCGCKVVE